MNSIPTKVADSVKRNLKFSFFESTPITTSKSRKRKSTDHKSTRKLNDIVETESYHSPKQEDSSSYSSCISECDEAKCLCEDFKSCSSHNQSLVSNNEFSFSFDHMTVSSPVLKTNEDIKLSSSLEKCSLFDFDLSAKKPKWDGDVTTGKKSNSAPGTPSRSGSDSESCIKKYHSLDFTPTKITSNVKIGTPESKKILYPQLVERKPAIKPKSPQKLRAELKRLNKPAKKRLFISHDFVDLFTRTSNNREIIKKIFSYLNDSDLANIVRVSKLWKNVLREDKEAYARYKKYSTNLIRSKENLRSNWSETTWNALNNSYTGQSSLTLEKENLIMRTSLISSPAKSNWHKYTKLAANLANNQQLTKCPMCGDPAVLERNIAQCTRHHCQYIWCVRCLSGSKQGPDHFICKCEKGTTPPRTEKSLGDISNLDSPRNCSFLTNDHYFNVSSNFNNTANSSSGYFSQSDVEKSNISKHEVSKTALSVSNRIISNEKKIVEAEKQLTSFHSVAELCMRKKLHKKTSYEPTSPPKVKMAIVGSEKSKKSLKRLCL